MPQKLQLNKLSYVQGVETVLTTVSTSLLNILTIARMNINKVIAICCAAIVCSLAGKAHTHLVINKDSDTEQRFSFADLSRINFSAKSLEFVAPTSTIVNFSDISTIHFNTPQSALHNLAVERVEMKLVMSHDGSTLRIEGINENSSLEIFRINGQKAIGKANYNGENINISSLATGVYIVKVGNAVKKFVK